MKCLLFLIIMLFRVKAHDDDVKTVSTTPHTFTSEEKQYNKHDHDAGLNSTKRFKC